MGHSVSERSGSYTAQSSFNTERDMESLPEPNETKSVTMGGGQEVQRALVGEMDWGME